MLKKIFFLFFLFLPVSVNAAPSITSISGSIVDGESITISGSDFGPNALNIEWLGGASGNIEQGTVGADFSKANWSADSTSSSRQAPIYSDTQAHSGSKSIKSSWPVESQYTSAFLYDTAISGVEKIYFTFWVFFDWVDSKGQWKSWRLRPDSNYNDRDGEIYHNQWYDTDGSKRMELLYVFCDFSDYYKCYPGGDGSLRWCDDWVRNDKWVRLEIYAEESSTSNAQDGTLIYKQHDQSGTPTDIVGPWDGTIRTRISDSHRWRYILFEGYWGNISGGDGTKEVCYYDDIYIQVGTQARLEIGDNATWADCVHREIQIPSAWSDTSITIKVNQGSFANCELAYLFVVDADGNVNTAGYPIRIVTGAGEAPCPPIGLKIK